MGCASANMCGNSDIGINVGGDTYLPLNFPIFMYEYGWTTSGSFPPSSGPGYSSGYYVGILQYNDSIGYFLTTQYTNNPNPSGYYDYYYSGSGWSWTGCGFLSLSESLHYYFELVSTQGNQGKEFKVCDNSYPLPFIPPDQQGNPYYSQYGVFWLYNWFQAENNAENNNMNIFFLMNGNIFNYSLASIYYQWNGGNAYAIPPNPPANTINGEPIFAQSYINAYNTAFNQPNLAINQKALNNYNYFAYNDVNSNFIPGTFGFREEYINNNGESFYINYLQDDENYYDDNPYLFISAGSGGGSGFMYLDWVIVTYGVPYVVSVS
jgi:hypothetical protein